MTQSSLYIDDVVSWAETQAAALRRLALSAPSNAVDWENVIEEIETVGRNEWNGVRSLLINAVDHLLRVAFDPDAPANRGWQAEIEVFLADARDDYRPSMRSHLDPDEIWRRGLRHAKRALARHDVVLPRTIPAASPFGLDELLDHSFHPDAGVARLRSIIHPNTSGDHA